MSKNITTTAKTLNKMGANASTTQKAITKITEGMGKAGKNTADNVAKTTASISMTTKSAIKINRIIQSELEKNRINEKNN